MCINISSDFRNLQSLDLCGGALTDAGVENIKDLSSLMFLNLSQNRNSTDKTLELLSGNFFLFSRPHANAGGNPNMMNSNVRLLALNSLCFQICGLEFDICCNLNGFSHININVPVENTRFSLIHGLNVVSVHIYMYVFRSGILCATLQKL